MRRRWPISESWVRLGFAGLLLLVATLIGWRYYQFSSRPKIAIRYNGGPIIRVPSGPTLLEISRMHGIPRVGAAAARAGHMSRAHR